MIFSVDISNIYNCFTGTPEAIAKNETPRFARNDYDVFNPYNVLMYYKNLCGDVNPEDRLYCHFLGWKQVQENVLRGSPQVINRRRPMGASSIGKLTKNLAKMAGITHWKKVTNHNTRQGGIDALTNNGAVNPKEVQIAARHCSIWPTNDPLIRVTLLAKWLSFLQVLLCVLQFKFLQWHPQ